MTAAGDPPPTVGVILAGGLSRRMGGGDKALLRLGGRQILARVVARLSPQCTAVVLNANGDPARFSSFRLPVVADSVPDYAGPLAGVLAGLDHVAETRPDIGWIVTAAADSPFLPGDFVARLHAARDAAQAALACARSGGRSHPVNGLWPVTLREELRRALLDEGVRKVDGWTARFTLAEAEWPSEPVDPFFNANTPEDVAEAERLVEALD